MAELKDDLRAGMAGGGGKATETALGQESPLKGSPSQRIA